jgi:hypothetical protein
MAWEVWQNNFVEWFHHNGVNKCMYSKFTKDLSVIIYLYVDDMLIFSTNMIGIVKTQRYLTLSLK